MKSTDAPVIVEQTFTASIQNVWNALTKLDEMKQWYFADIKSFRPEVGFETRFRVQVEDRKFTHLWKVTEVLPLQKITYNWKYEEYPGDSFVTFELLQEQRKVKLRLLVKIVENFPSHIPEFSRESCIGGWNYFIKKNLTEYLAANST
jgi:uncharacterized protein YndB with AHSA1/START domain